MELNNGERIVKIYHHHPFPFIIQLVKTVVVSIPFFILLYAISSVLNPQQMIIAILIIVGLFSLVIIYLALIYWLDKLVITNQRVVHIDWKVLTKRDEGEALLYDIQDIHTEEKGLLSALYLFDYGLIRVETAASKATLVFTEAPDPEGIKSFLTDHIRACKPEARCIPRIQPSPSID